MHSGIAWKCINPVLHFPQKGCLYFVTAFFYFILNRLAVWCCLGCSVVLVLFIYYYSRHSTSPGSSVSLPCTDSGSLTPANLIQYPGNQVSKRECCFHYRAFQMRLLWTLAFGFFYWDLHLSSRSSSFSFLPHGYYWKDKPVLHRLRKLI